MEVSSNSSTLSSNVPLAGKLNNFLSAWQRITTDSVILLYVGGYKIPLLETLRQTQPQPPVKVKSND